MENGITDGATVGPRPRLYGIVQTYIQKRLPRDIHPAFKTLRDREDASIIPSQIEPTGETTSTLLVGRASRIVQAGGGKDDEEDDDDDLPLYAAS